MKNKDKNSVKFFVLVALLVITIGYAIVTTTIMLIKTSPSNERQVVNGNGTQQENDSKNDNSNKSSTTNNNSENKKNNIDKNFDVYFLSNDTSPYIEKGTGKASIGYDKKTAKFDFTNMTKVGETAIVKYTIYNNSKDLDASLNVKITNSSSEYFKVTKKIDNTTLKAKNKTVLTITVELIAVPLEGEKKASISTLLVATPI